MENFTERFGRQSIYSSVGVCNDVGVAKILISLQRHTWLVPFPAKTLFPFPRGTAIFVLIRRPNEVILERDSFQQSKLQLGEIITAAAQAVILTSHFFRLSDG